jgi:amidase
VTDALPFDDPLGAFCRDNHAALDGSGKGPLKGLAFAAKDLFDIKGARTGFGQPDWLRTHEPARKTAKALQQVLAAGADLVGKTHCDELCYSLTGENVHYGTPINVNAPGRIPGGSSNGSAAAVAGKLVDFALGSDCGGSIRIPASYCGLYGIRPTHGRVSLAGAVPFGPSFDVAGWFARDAALLEKVGRVLLPKREKTPRVKRILIATDAFALVDPAVKKALQPAVRKLKAAVGRSVDVTVAPEGLREWFETFRTLQAAEVWASVGDWIEQAKPQLGQGVKERIAWASTVPADAVAAANAKRRAIRRHLDRLLEPGDVLCLPTSPRVAPKRDLPVDTIEVEFRNQAMCLLCIAGLAGLPQISMPLAKLEGLPLGLSIVGRRGSDEALLALNARLNSRASSRAPKRSNGSRKRSSRRA